MLFPQDSDIFKGVMLTANMMGATLPFMFTTPRDEYLACRRSAWLGVCLNLTPIYVVSGPDAAKLLNKVCVNKDFSLMKEGQSKHALICNENGHMIADGVIMKEAGTTYRTYWMAPVLTYYVMNSGLDVQGEFVQDEYFFQIDGPKSLEILEEATQTDLHDIKFAHNKRVKICGTDMVVHRLGMSGALAYEVHGRAEDAEIAYAKIREVLEKYDGRLQGVANYGIINHTPGGYPNQMQHYIYPYGECDPALEAFIKNCGVSVMHGCGSAAVDETMYYVYPHEVGWGYLVNYDHDFIGKEALLKIRQNPPRKVVTLEWNADDVGEIFASNFKGTDVEPYDPIESMTDGAPGLFTSGDLVMNGDDVVGLSVGRTWAFHERRMVSLAYIKPEYAEEGKELMVLWGNPGKPQKIVHVRVAQFPYYQGEYRNETFNTEKIPHLYAK